MATSREQTAPFNQFRASQNMVSWRHQRVEVSGHGLKTLHFMDTNPNLFMIQNPTSATLYIGISSIPTVNNYEFKVAPNSSKTFGRPIPTDELYILNISNADISINLFSVLDKFDLSLMTDTSVTLNDAVIAAMKSDGMINGFASGVSLPAGTKHIGEVSLSGALPAGTNHIGKVSLSGAIPAGTNHIGEVTMSGEIPAGTNHIGEVSMSGALPAGANHIGEVSMSGALPAGTNHIGEVSLASSTSINAELDSATKANIATSAEKAASSDTYLSQIESNMSSIKNNVIGCYENMRDMMWCMSDTYTGTNMLALILEKLTAISTATAAPTLAETIADTIFYQKENVTSAQTLVFTESVIDGVTTAATERFYANRMMFFSNDGEKDISMKLYRNSTDYTEITMKSGESVSNWNMKNPVVKIAPKTSGDTISYRVMYGLAESEV